MIVFTPDDRDQYTDEVADLLTESVAFALYMSTEADVVEPSVQTWDQAHPFLRNQRRTEARDLVGQLGSMGLAVVTYEDPRNVVSTKLDAILAALKRSGIVPPAPDGGEEEDQ